MTCTVCGCNQFWKIGTLWVCKVCKAIYKLRKR